MRRPAGPFVRAKYVIVLGIRPDIINYEPLVRRLRGRNADLKIVHTGQHYSYFFDGLFFDQLGFPKPDYHLGVGSGTQAEQLAELAKKFEAVLAKERPDLVFSFSDANPALAGIVASKMGVKVVHLEAGMRSGDWRMPEEKNRRLLDSISDYLFTPTRGTEANLLGEGIARHRIHRIGKPIYEVLTDFAGRIDKSPVLDELGVERGGYFLATAHRPENVGSRRPLSSILGALGELGRTYGAPVVFPAHPRTQESIRRLGVRVPRGVRMTDPVGFLEFSKLEKNAMCCVTDSGTVQEDSCIFKVPCVTARISTERPETVEAGSNIVAGVVRSHIVEAARIVLGRDRRAWRNPYGRPDCSARVVRALERIDSEVRSPKVWWDHPRAGSGSETSRYRARWRDPAVPDGI